MKSYVRAHLLRRRSLFQLYLFKWLQSKKKGDSLPQSGSLVSYAFDNFACRPLCSGCRRPGAGQPPLCVRRRCRPRPYVVQRQEWKIFLVLCVSTHPCSRLLRLMTFSINNVSDCSRNCNSHFDGPNRMDFRGYDLAQRSALDGRLHRPEQRVSQRILSPACVYGLLISSPSNLWAPQCYYTGSEFLVYILFLSLLKFPILYFIGLVRGFQHGLSKGAMEPERSIFNHPVYHGLLSTPCSLPSFWPNLPLEPLDLSQISAWSLRLPPPTTTM